MDENTEMNSLQKKGRSNQVVDALIVLGVIFTIAFAVMLPVFVLHFYISTQLIIYSILGYIIIALIYLLFNTVYRSIISMPMLMAGLFFGLGWALYIFTPFQSSVVLFVSRFLDIFYGIFKIGGLNNNTTGYLSTVLSHTGIFMVVTGAILWWFKQKNEDIKFKVLTIYLAFFAVVGASLAMRGIQNVLFFLLIWLILYSKVVKAISSSQFEDEEKVLKGTKYLFKIAGTLVILFGITGIHLLGNGLDIHIPLGFTRVSFPFYVLYQDLILVLILVGIWISGIIHSITPKFLKNFWEFMLEKSSFIKI